MGMNKANAGSAVSNFYSRFPRPLNTAVNQTNPLHEVTNATGEEVMLFATALQGKR